MILSAKVSNKIKDSMSQARKIFRFLNFVGEIRKIQNSAKSNKYWLFKILDILGHLSSLLYYIHDNILWAINIGILR